MRNAPRLGSTGGELFDLPSLYAGHPSGFVSLWNGEDFRPVVGRVAARNTGNRSRVLKPNKGSPPGR